MNRIPIRFVWYFLISCSLAIGGCSYELSSGGTESSNFENDEVLLTAYDGVIDARVPLRPVVGAKSMLVTVTHWQGERVLDRNQVEKHTLSTDPDSLRSYILAASGGKLTLNGRVVESTRPKPEGCGGMPMGLSITEGRKTAQEHGLNSDDFDYVMNVVNCGGAASAQLGGRYTGVYGKAGSPHVYKHEFGHNLGFSHGGTLVGCPRNGQTVSAPAGCMYISLGDTGDSVSGGGTLYPAISRRYAGWLDDGQATTINHTGLYSLRVLGRMGPQLYIIKNPENPSTAPSYPFLTMEYRKPTIFDHFPGGDNRTTGVWMRYARANGIQNVQIDMTPETATTADPTLQVGQTFEEYSGKVKVYVCYAGEYEAIIRVALNGDAFPYCTTTVAAPIIEAPLEKAKTGKRPVFAGTARPGARVDLLSSVNLDQVVGSTIADGNGKWSVSVRSLHEVGKYAYTARQYFGTLSSSLAGVRSFEVADLAVSLAIIETPAEAVGTGRKPFVSGTGIPGATVVLLKSNEPYDALATAVVDGYGHWSVQLENNLPVSPPVFTMTGYQVLDGKRSGWLAGRRINVVDVPDPAIIETPAENISTGQRPVVSGSGIAGATVVLLKANEPNNALATTTVDGHGRWSVQVEQPLPVSPAVFTMTGYQVLEGKRSGWLASRRINIVQIPEPAIITAPEKNATTGRRPTIFGTGVAGATVLLMQAYKPDVVLATAVVGGDGTWSVRMPDLLPIGTFHLSGYQAIDGKRSGWIINHPLRVLYDRAFKKTLE